MKFLYDALSIIVFFIVFKIYGIYAATAAAMIISLIQLTAYWVLYQKIDKGLLMTFIIIMVLGGATLFFHNPLFVQWKPSIVYWVFAIVLFGSHFVGNKTIMQRLLEAQIDIPKKIWTRLNLMWGLFFFIMGFINLYVVYNYSENAWVNFKLFGTLGLTIVLVIVQAAYLARHIKND